MKQAHVLNKQELKRVLAICQPTKLGKRNRIAILLSHYAGLRVGEIAALKWHDVLDENSTIKSIFYLSAAITKNSNARAVHLNNKLQAELRIFRDTLLSEAAHKTANLKIAALISSQKDGHFSANSLCQLFGRIYAEAGIYDASSHSGRRWFITKLAHAGISPKVIMELAGHKQLTTTQRYIEVNEEMKKEAVEVL